MLHYSALITAVDIEFPTLLYLFILYRPIVQSPSQDKRMKVEQQDGIPHQGEVDVEIPRGQRNASIQQQKTMRQDV